MSQIGEFFFFLFLFLFLLIKSLYCRSLLSNDTVKDLDLSRLQCLGPPCTPCQSSVPFEDKGYAKRVRKEGRDYTVGISCESPTAIVAPTAEPKIERMSEGEDEGMKIRRFILEVCFRGNVIGVFKKLSSGC